MGTFGTDRFRRIATAGVLVAGMLALAGCFASPADPVAESSAAATDAESGLERDVRTTFDQPWERAAVAVIDGDGTEAIFVEADETTVYEIGNISMALTGELFAIAVERGEVAPDDPLGAYLPLGDTPASGVTLRSLATHSSGLPRHPTDAATEAAIDEAAATHGNPFSYTLDQLIELARLETVTDPGQSLYSEFGAALLGHALAAAARTDYESLLQERVLSPLGMEGAIVVETDDEVPSEHAGGHYVDGAEVEPTVVGAYGPALGVTATLPDLIALAEAVLDGAMSDSAAIDPASETGGQWPTSVGYLWEVQEEPARTITYTLGFTNGFSAALLIDRDAGHASIVLVNSDTDVSEYALRYLNAFADG
ncbi:serine hydrolase domain-containing protein [Agromyces sp. NPDC057865]|uniref:serine hydrolase domain-containing protein n=1 Tax=Agromyces sp. NPDC057865 TaxID=3346267 RepID=UPI00366D81FC